MSRCLPSVVLPRVVLTTIFALAVLLGLIPWASAESNSPAANAAASSSAAAPAAPEAAPSATGDRKPKVPPFSVVEKVVARELAKKSGYKSGDLITSGDVAGVNPTLEKLGFNVAKTSKGLDFVMADDHPLVVLLRTPQGERLMTRIKNLETALDRLDRLCGFPAGLELVKKVVVAPNGLEVIEQLCLPETARGLAGKYPDEPICQTLDLPSGRAFTERQYLERLRTIHMLAQRGLTRPGE